MATVSYTNIYSNDGSTVLFTSSQQYTPDGSANATVTETGVTFPSEIYTYSGNKKFLGISSSANATTPTYAIGDTFILGATSSLYIVEEETKEYTLRIDGVEVTDYDNVVVNGVSYKCKKEEAEEETSYFYCQLIGYSTLYAFEQSADSPLSWSFLDGVFDVTNTVSIYIDSGGINPYVYLNINRTNFQSNPILIADEIPLIGSTYTFGSNTGGGTD